jgi:hypothetical protein
MRIGRGNPSTRRKPAPVTLFPHYLTRFRTRLAAVGSLEQAYFMPDEVQTRDTWALASGRRFTSHRLIYFDCYFIEIITGYLFIIKESEVPHLK